MAPRTWAGKKRPVNSSDEEDEDEDEEAHKEQMQGFLNDDDDESGSEDERSRKRKKKKRRRRRSGSSGSRSGSGSSKSRSRSGSGSGGRRRRSDDEDLDEDDMDLIEENLGVKIEKKRKRIQMASSDEDGSDGGGARSGSDDDLPDPQRARSRSGSRGGSDEEDIGGFIVDEEGRPIERKKAKRKHIFEDSQRQLAEDIFGVAFDYDEFEQYDQKSDESESDDYDDDDMDEEKIRRKEKKKRKTAKTIFDIFDPHDLAMGHYTEVDGEIRLTDIPERMQLRQIPVTAVSDDSDELDREADWIYKKGFTEPTLTQQIGYMKEDCDEWLQKTATVEKIKKALDFMRQQFLEVPFIAFYRKEYVSPELQITDLWRVYYMDEKWCQLQNRKKNVRRLMERMQSYQGDTLLEDPDAPLPEGIKLISQEDFDRLEGVETVEELKGVYDYFLLYHARNLGPCQEHFRKKAKEEKEAKRLRKKLGKQKKYKTVREKVTKTVTRTVSKTVTETVTNDDGEEEEIEKEIEEEVETDVETEEEKEVTDDEAVDEDNPESDEEADEPDDQDEDEIKFAKRNDAYSLCVKYGISGMASRFGLTPEQFGENLRDGYARNETEQDPSDVSEVATEYLTEKLKNVEDVVKAAVFMVATQLAREPLVRQTVREVFQERATISCRPTAKGVKDIDDNNEIYQMKYLKDKPVRDFKDEDFLKLQAAAESKLIELTVAEEVLGQSSAQTFLTEAQDLYKLDAYAKSVVNWNKLRSDAVEMAFKKMLYPALRKELIHKLRGEAVDGVKRSVQRTLYEWIKWAPYTNDFDPQIVDEELWDISEGARVLGICYSEDQEEASYGALINLQGEVSDFIKLSYLTTRDNAYIEKERIGKAEDMQALRKFIKQRRPHVIGISANGMDARGVQADINKILEDLVSTEEFPEAVQTVLVDNNLSKVYSNTNKSSQDFREYPQVLKEAVSIARRLQDPLVEFSQLCGPENDILCLRYHPMQEIVGEQKLGEAINLEFINRVNEVGVDINDCVNHPFKSNLVQFVGGLGPRKGANLLKTLRGMTNPRLENRQQLVTSCHMGPKVFINCAGFIKIDTTSLGDSEIYVEVLDGSRIHNEAYEWARKMAVDALEYDEDEGNPASAMEDILRQPEKLDELNLDAFAEELERQGFGNKQITLYDIRTELGQMYKDQRTAWEKPDDIELFNMLTKESPRTFYIGKLLMATAINFKYRKPTGEELDKAAPVRAQKGDVEQWQCPFCGMDDFPELTEVWNHFDAVDEVNGCRGKCVGVTVRLDNGVIGTIFMKNFSTDIVLNPEERVKRGQRVWVRINQIKPDRFFVECTSKSSDLVDADWNLKPQRDAYYDTELEEKDKEKSTVQAQAKKGSTYIRRVITHSSFHNISYKEAEKMLATMDQGDCIIRPSSKGQDHLTVTWKVYENIYSHIDVREENKANSFSLGQSLWIGNEEFEDLDEIIARHINPMASNSRDILSFKYFRPDTNGGDKTKCEQLIIAEKRQNPTKIHYFFSASREMPGKFMLTYVPREKPRHEYVTATPDGYRFRHQNFETLSHLMKWFKEHFRDPIPGTPTPGNRSNRTPYGSVTPGGSRSAGGITPGAMSMAGANTPYGQTPGFGRSAPYTPTANP